MYNRLCIFFASMFMVCFTSFAQSGNHAKQYQRFSNEADRMKNDTSKVLRYLEFASAYIHVSPDSGEDIVSKAKALSIKLHYKRGIELSVFRQGLYEEEKKNLPLALYYYNEAAKIAEANKWYIDIYSIYGACLNLYYYLADYPNAMNIAQKGLALAEQFNIKQDQAHFDSQIGFIYQKQEKADESIKYYKRYLTLSNEINNNMMVADACNGVADGYRLKNDYETALSYSFKALEIYDKMNGDANHDGQRFDRMRYVFKHDRVAYTLYLISSIYRQAGNYPQALHYALMIFKGKMAYNQYDLASYYINAGEIYTALKNYKQAGLLLGRGLSIARSIFHREDTRDAYEGLSNNFAAQKRYDSAYYYHVLFTQLKDSIINDKVSRQINKLAMDGRDKEIALLNQQQRLKETETARATLKRNFFIGFAALIVIISFLLFYIQSKDKQQKLVLEKQAAIYNERQRISSDMHDDIGTGLSTMLIYVNMLKLKLAGSDDGPNVERIAQLGTGLVDQMKEIVWALTPGNDRLDSLLLFARQYFVLLFEPLHYQTSIIFPVSIPEMELEGEVRRNIFLCIKEALNNIIKHANATYVELKVEITNKYLIIEIKDNGRGLAFLSNGAATGNGLKNIIRRMNNIKGEAGIFNDQGTVVRLRLALSYYPNG